MSANRSPAPALLWRARLRLAALSLLVMGTILYGAVFAMARLLLQERETSLRRELQTVAGTLHDSLKPSLPPVAVPSAALAAVQAPAGLDIHAITPDEIALSILAQIVALRRAGGRRSEGRRGLAFRTRPQRRR